jgi:transposase InsO family protein
MRIKSGGSHETVCTILEQCSALPKNIFGDDTQRAAQETICTKYEKVFSRELNREPAGIEPMQIEIRDSQTDVWNSKDNKRPPRIQSALKDAEIDRQVQKMLEANVIRKSKAAVSYSQVLMVPKPDASWRFCVDYRRLNACTNTKKWPIPNISLMIDRLGRKKLKYFALMDLTKGYYQAPLAENSRHLSAFITSRGLFEWNRVAMGLCGAPAYYQEQMATTVLGNLMYVSAEVYMDDIIVFGTTFEEYLANLEKVLQRLHEHGITVNPDKCNLGVREVKFVGHTFDENGKSFDRSKLQEVVDFHLPANEGELRSFLGMVNYFSDHIRDHAEICKPLHDMIDKTRNYKKGKTLHWTEHQLARFKQIQQCINDCPKLFFLQEDAENSTVHLYTDASDIGFGIYICQRFADGTEHPIAFMSRCFTETQKRWSVPEREGYGLHEGVMKFDYLLRDVNFVMHTDHANLVYIRDSGSPKVIRWKLQLQEFLFTVEHVKGVDNIVADVMSRNTSAVVDVDTPDCLPQHEWLACLWNSPQSMFRDEDVIPEMCCALEERSHISKIPDNRYNLIMQAHNADVGHHGVQNTMRKLENIGCTWLHMEDHVKLFIKQCDCCQKLDDRVPIRIVNQFSLGGNKPMECWNVDSIGPFDADQDGNTYAVVLVDIFTRFMCIYPVPDTSAKEAVKAMIKHSGHYGMPEVIRTDNGTEYKNELMTEGLKLLGSEQMFTIAHQHQQNGIVERCNKEVNDYLRQMLYCKHMEKGRWSELLPFVQRIHNATICSSTGYSPADLVFGGTIKLSKVVLTENESNNKELTTYQEYVSEMIEHQRNMLEEASQIQNKKYLSKKDNKSVETLTTYPPGSYVLLAWPITRMNPNGRPTKFDTLYRGPFKVIKHDDKGTYWLLNIVTGRPENLKSIHSLKPYFYDPDRTDPLQVALKDFKDEYLVESILGDNGKWNNKADLKFHIKWVGYTDTTWEFWANLRDNSVLHEYLLAHNRKKMIPKKIVQEEEL